MLIGTPYEIWPGPIIKKEPPRSPTKRSRAQADDSEDTCDSLRRHQYR